MAQDVVTIWNLALSAASSKALVSAQNEQTREADLCRLWYDMVRQTVLKSASWPCAISWARLALRRERGPEDWQTSDPAPGYKYQYAEPVDCLAPRYLFDYSRFDRGVVANTKVINCNSEQAILRYTRDQTNVGTWDVGLQSAIVNTLGAQISMDLSGKTFIYDRLMNKARETVLLSQTEIANESDDLYDDIPTWIKVRGYEGEKPLHKYFYPYENFNGIAP